MNRKPWAALSAAAFFAAVTPVLAQEQQPAEPDAQQQSTDYGGPGILTRGAGSLFRVPASSLKFVPFAAIMGSYDTGLSGIYTEADGTTRTLATTGVTATAGVTGFLRRRLDQVSLTYFGSYNHYTQNNFLNGTNQSLALGYQRALSRNLSISIRELAGISSRVNFLAGGGAGWYGAIDPSFAGVPANELFDNPVIYSSTMFDTVYRKSARLSFNFGGDFMTAKRRSNALFGYNVGRARGDAAYRLSRHSTFGVAYEFNHFEFSRSFGASDIHGVQLFYSRRLNRRVEIGLRAGGQRVETLGIGRVDIPAELAAIFGTSFGYEAVYRNNYLPAFQARISAGGRHNRGGIQYQSGVSPGNGIFLTSRQNLVSADYTYSGIRNWHLSANASYGTLSGLAQQIGRFERTQVGGSVSRALISSIFLTAQTTWFQTSVRQSAFDRTSYRATIGLTFSPGEFPISIW